MFAIALLTSATAAPQEPDAQYRRPLPVPVRADTQRVCPPGGEFMRSVVTGFVSRDRYVDTRAEIGMPRMDTSRVRLLTDDEDRAVCRRLLEDGPLPEPDPSSDQVWAAYQAGDFYFVTSAPRRMKERMEQGELFIGHTPLFVLDQDLNPLHAGLL